MILSWNRLLLLSFYKNNSQRTNTYNSHSPLIALFDRAAANGHIEVMELLLASGVADPSITNSAGNTALVSRAEELVPSGCMRLFCTYNISL
jgi:ankyrin repeat protein